jgi:transposase
VLSSLRRVKKGPGRRPQSAKRQRFMELRSRGWSIMAAAREVGVSRTAGHNWSRGYKTYRNGQVTGFVPALDRLAMREISGWFLSQDERIEIADLRHAGLSIRQVAARLGRAPSTIPRELRRNAAISGRPAAAGLTGSTPGAGECGAGTGGSVPGHRPRGVACPSLSRGRAALVHGEAQAQVEAQARLGTEPCRRRDVARR